MTRSAALWTTVLCLAVVVSSAPVQDSKCMIQCPKIPNPKLKHELEKTYVYDLKASSFIQVKDVQESDVQFQVEGQVHLTFNQPCMASLQIKNYRYADNTKINVTDLPLVLAIVDGQVQHVCVHPLDSAESANVKMGVASQFQNSLPSLVNLPEEGRFRYNFTEMDTQGKCVTNYIVGQARDEVTKVKNSRACSDHALLPYPSNMSIPWSQMPLPPLYESTTTCKQQFKENIYSKVKCTETTIIKPIPGMYKYVKSWQKTELSFVNKINPVSQTNFNKYNKPLNLTVIYPKPKEIQGDLVEDLKNLCNDLSTPIKETAAKHLVRVVKHLRHRNVVKVMNTVLPQMQCENKPMLESLLQDAVAFTGKAGIPYMVKEIVASKAEGGRTLLYALALQMESHPNISTIESLKELFEMTNAPSEVLLASGSVIKTYCHQEPLWREKPQIMTILNTIKRKLEASMESSGNKRELMTLLKTVGNMGRVAISLTTEIIQMAKKNPEIPVRVAAIQALRDVPCTSEMSNGLMKILKRVEEVPEVRVVAYLESVRCLSKEQLREVVSMLISEPSVQVRNFVLTHLTNLQETDAPYKQYVRHLLSQNLLPTDYRADITKFSRDIELSYYSPTLGSGANLDTSIIYSNESILPRLVNTKFGAEILHQLKKIIEFGARVEQKSSGPTLDTKTSSRESLWEYVGKYLKSENTLSRLLKELKVPSWLVPGIENVEVFLRVIAQELLARPLPLSMPDLILQSVNTARGIPIEIDYIIPTIQGIPLHMEISGAAVLRLEMQSDLKLSNIVKMEDSSSEAKLQPSLSIQADGFIGFKLPGQKTGIQMRNKIHTSTTSNIKLDVQNGEAQVKISLPKGMPPTTLSTQTVLVERGHEKPFPSSYSHFEKKFETLGDPVEIMLAYGKKPEPFFEIVTKSLPLIGSQSMKAKLEQSTDESSIVVYYSHSPKRTYSEDSILAKVSLVMKEVQQGVIPRILDMEVRLMDLYKLHIHSQVSETEYVVTLSSSWTPVEGMYQNVNLHLDNNLEKRVLNGYAKWESPQGSSRFTIDAHHRVDARDYTAEIQGTIRIGNSEYPYKTTLHLPSLAWTKESQKQLNQMDLTWTLPSMVKPHIMLQVKPSQSSVLLLLETLGDQQQKYLGKIDLQWPSLFWNDETTDKRTSSLSGELMVPGLEALTFDATLENMESSRDINATFVPWWKRSFLLKAHVPFKSIGDIELQMKRNPSDQGIQMTLKRKVTDKTMLVQWMWTPSKAQLMIQTPSRTMEADLTTTSPYTLRLKPDVSKPKMEYEVSIPLTSTGFSVIMKVPNVDKKVEARVNVAQSTVDIDMDIFSQSDKRIKLHADFFKSTTGVYRAQGKVISKMPESKELPFTIDIHRMLNETSYCHGYMANFFWPMGQYLVTSRMCAPAYIEATLKPMNSMGSGPEYHVHLGVRDPQEAALVLDVQEPKHWKPVDVVGLRLQRENPFMVNGIVTYQKEKFNTIKNKLTKIVKTIKEWILEHGEGKKEPIPVMINQIHQDANAIVTDWKKDKFIVDLMMVLDEEILPYVFKLEKLFKQLGLNLVWSPSFIPQGIVKELGSDGILSLIEPVWYKIEESKIWKAFEKTKLYATLKSTIDKYMDVDKYRNELGWDLKKAYDWMNWKHQGQMIDYVIDYLQQSKEYPDRISTMSMMWDKVKKMVGFGFMLEKGKVVLHVPMVRPLYYISSLPYGFNVPDLMPLMKWPMYLTRALVWGEFEPYGSVQAWIRDDGRIRTFDGLYKTMDLSTTPHILAKIDESRYIQLQMASENTYQVSLMWEGKKYLIQISPKREILVNGQTLKEGDVLYEKIVTIVNNVGQVVIRLPDLTVTARKTGLLVTVDPGVIYKGSLRGLLGTYDDNTSDDRVTLKTN
ncbi:uncharacterized protein LOC143028194 [Oratosquilla oratoria]|uniref:uncharacterized protein LOC143028194 n=1 Tax=Oratosquilla oratoria TaxID=337810 RepID=UPI003F76542B